MHIHHSNSLETLAADFAARVRENPADPFAPERVVVSHPTMRRWLNLELARANGIAANFRFELPAEFAWSMIRNVLPDLPRQQPFAPDNLRWRLFDVLPDFTKKPWGEPVRRYLADSDPRKRFEFAQEIAQVFDRCLLYRPHWIREWEKDETPHWQARLWQLLVETIGKDHWVSALDAFREALDDDEVSARWPERVTFFAVPALSPSYLDMIRRIAEKVELHFYLFNPCREYWGDIFTRFETVVRSGSDDPEVLHITEGNELLAAYGRIGRDTFDALLDLEAAQDFDKFAELENRHRLADVQRDILALRLAENGDNRDGVAADESLQIHACHSATREAEVLHDRLLDLFERNEDIQPADIQILTPDLERCGPAVVAVFDSLNQIKVTLSRARSEESPSSRAFFDLLALVRSRYGAEDVMAPLDAPAIRKCFGIGEENLVLIRQWVSEAAIRWGVDSEHRQGEGQPTESGNTWYEGLRRLLMGYAVVDTRRLVHDIAPSRVRGIGFQVASETEFEVLGRFVSYCEAVFELRRILDGERKARDWTAALHQTIDRFFIPAVATIGFEIADEVDALRSLVKDFEDQATQGNTALPFEVVRDVLSDLAGTQSRRPAFLGDGVTMTQLAEGQILPSRVICVVGMNSDAFPRTPTPFTFDLVANGPRQRGDRDLRHEDRFAFLEALISAKTSFIVTYTGRGIRDDAPIPPSVVVDELLDYLADRFPDGAFRTEHPLQPFDARYFRANVGLFSYASAMCDTARALLEQGAQDADPDRFKGKLPEPGDERRTIGLAGLERFFADPARAFLRERLGVLLVEDDTALQEDDPFDLNRLEQYQLRAEIEEMCLAETSPEDIEALMLRSGKLPPGPPGVVLFRHELETVQELSELLARHEAAIEAEPVQLDFEIAGYRVTGSVLNVGSDALVWWRPGRLRAIDRITIHLRQLALMAQGHGPRMACAIVQEGGEWKELIFGAPAEQDLDVWLDAWWQGQMAPLPFAPKTSLAYFDAVRRELERTGIRVAPGNDYGKARTDAHQAWYGRPGVPGEGSKPDLALVWDGRDPLEQGFTDWARLLSMPPPGRS